MRSRQMVGNILILETAFLWSFLGIVTKMVTYHGMTVTAVISEPKHVCRRCVTEGLRFGGIVRFC